MLPDREGLFHANPVEIGVAETGPNNLATVVIRFRLFEELVGGKWQDCFSEGLEITGYFYLEKRDGSLNEPTLDALKAALGWDGRDPFWLQETDLSEKPVQVKLGFEEYRGQQRLKVLFLNPYGATGGGITKADGAGKTAIRDRLGPKLRALAGPTPAKKPKAAPKQAPPDPPAEPQEPPADEATMDEAWEEFCKHCPPEKWDRDEVEREWFSVLSQLFPGKQPAELTPREWAVMRDEGPSRIVPF